MVKKSKVVIDANSVSVIPRHRGLPELEKEKTRSRMLANLLRAYEKAFASSAVSTILSSPQTPGVDEAAVRQQLADSQLNAARIPRLRKAVTDLANQISLLDNEWKTYVASLNKTHRDMDARLRNELTSISNRVRRKGRLTPAEQSAIVSLATTKRIANETQKSQLIAQASERKNALREQVENANLQLLQNQQELQTALQAAGQAKELQKQLNQLTKAKRGSLGIAALLRQPRQVSTPKKVVGTRKRAMKR